MKKYVVINDAALGHWKLEVGDICEHMDGSYAFEWFGEAVDLTTGEVCNDEEFKQMLADYAMEEGYAEQNINAQLSVIWDAYWTENEAA